MFAYVKYIDDGCKEIVPSSDIKDFNGNVGHYDIKKIYWVRWQEEFFKAQILLLKESREEIEEELSAGKRVRVRLLKETSPAPHPSEKNDAKAMHTNQKKAVEEAKKTNLLAILQERRNLKRKSPICPTPLKKVRERILSDRFSEEDGDDDDDGGIVPEKLLKEAKEKQHLYLKKYKEMSLQLQETRKQLDDQKSSRAAVEAENKTLRALNIELQQQLLKKLNSTSTPNVAETGCKTGEEPTVSPVGDKITLGGDIDIRKEAWVRINNNNRDSLFVKELAVAIWGTKTLGERSLTGKECPTTKTTRRPLTPKKLQTLKVCFKEWLQEKNLEETELQARWAKAGRYITEKIMDINKQKKKSLD